MGGCLPPSRVPRSPPEDISATLKALAIGDLGQKLGIAA